MILLGQLCHVITPMAGQRAALLLALALAGVLSASAAMQELPGFKTQFEVVTAGGDGR